MAGKAGRKEGMRVTNGGQKGETEDGQNKKNGDETRKEVIT